MIRLNSKWLLMACVALFTACSADTTVLGPAQPASQLSAPSIGVREQLQLPRIEPAPSVVDRNMGTANSQAERQPTGPFSRYAMAAS